jgi:dihydrofolate reductase
MRKVILCVAVSLDGYIEGPGGEYDWCFTDQDYGMTDFMKRIDSIFFGRKSYEVMLKADATGQNPFGSLTSYVFSNTLTVPYEGTQLVSGDLKKEVMDIKQLPGKDIWLFGGAALTTQFLNENLIDEMILAVHPLLLGEGKLLFQQIDGRKKFKLLQSTPFTSGLVILHYVSA